ncbi:MAG: carbohydrate ABC transporter permease [Spirochaetia bacterium]
MKRTSKLSFREGQTAYILLLPSFIILIVIGFYPLGSVFTNSLTNRTFAGGAPTEFIGLENYFKLLSLTIQPVSQQMDEDGSPQIDPETGEVVYERPSMVLREYNTNFRELNTFNFLGNRYVIGARDRDFIKSLVDTVTFTVLSVFLETMIGLGVALVLNSQFKGRGVLRAVMLIPWAVPTAVSSRMWEWMFASSRAGIVNVFGQILGFTNGQFSFLSAESTQLWVMVIIDVWKTTPFMALLILAGLQLISNDMYEAAEVDGASKVRQFWSLTLPILKPTIAVALVFRTLDALRVFDLFQIVFGMSRYSMASFTYYELVQNKAMGYSAAASVVIFILIFFFDVMYIKMIGGVDDD